MRDRRGLVEDGSLLLNLIDEKLNLVSAEIAQAKRRVAEAATMTLRQLKAVSRLLLTDESPSDSGFANLNAKFVGHRDSQSLKTFLRRNNDNEGPSSREGAFTGSKLRAALRGRVGWADGMFAMNRKDRLGSVGRSECSQTERQHGKKSLYRRQ